MRTPPTLIQTCVLLLQVALIAGCGPLAKSANASSIKPAGSNAATATSGAVVQINPSMSQSEIQSEINSSQPGDTIAFAAGTYNLAVMPNNPNDAGLNLLPNRTYLGSKTGATILSGSGGYMLAVFYGSGLTVQNIVFNGGGLYLGGAVTNVNVEYNVFENIPAPNGNWTTEIGVFMDTNASNSDISYNKFENIGSSVLSQYVDEVYSTGIFGYGLSNTTITYNTFDTFNEGIHIFYNSLDGINVQIDHNQFTNGHRIAIEQQNSLAGGLEVAYNSVSQPLNPWALTFGLSIAASSQTSTGISVHDNTLNGNVAVSTSCPGYPGAGCYLPYGIEAWGNGTHVYNNTVEGLWTNGVAIGAASNLSVTNNLICGPNMAQSNTFVDFEYGSEPGTLIQSNTTSANMTCGTGN